MRIMLVEDDRPLAEALTTLLVQSGYAVDTVHDGLSAEALGASERFDLVILDLNLPEMDGLAVLRAMRARSDDAAVMILTARGAPEDRVRGLNLGADDYLTKPFDIAEFEARVRSLLRRQAGLRASTLTVGAVTLDLISRRLSTASGPIDCCRSLPSIMVGIRFARSFSLLPFVILHVDILVISGFVDGHRVIGC